METELANGVSLGELIRKTRLTVAISQADLVRRIGTTKQYVTKVERNIVSPKADTLQRIALAMFIYNLEFLRRYCNNYQKIDFGILESIYRIRFAQKDVPI